MSTYISNINSYYFTTTVEINANYSSKEFFCNGATWIIKIENITNNSMDIKFSYNGNPRNTSSVRLSINNGSKNECFSIDRKNHYIHNYSLDEFYNKNFCLYQFQYDSIETINKITVGITLINSSTDYSYLQYFSEKVIPENYILLPSASSYNDVYIHEIEGKQYIYSKYIDQINNFNNFTQEYSDVEFEIGKHQKVIKAHRVILASRCPSFKILFEEQALHNNSSNGILRIVLPSYNYTSFKALIDYHYKGKCYIPKSRKVLGDLLDLAYQYHVYNLIESIEEKLANPENNYLEEENEEIDTDTFENEEINSNNRDIHLFKLDSILKSKTLKCQKCSNGQLKRKRELNEIDDLLLLNDQRYANGKYKTIRLTEQGEEYYDGFNYNRMKKQSTMNEGMDDSYKNMFNSIRFTENEPGLSEDSILNEIDSEEGDQQLSKDIRVEIIDVESGLSDSNPEERMSENDRDVEEYETDRVEVNVSLDETKSNSDDKMNEIVDLPVEFDDNKEKNEDDYENGYEEEIENVENEVIENEEMENEEIENEVIENEEIENVENEVIENEVIENEEIENEEIENEEIENEVIENEEIENEVIENEEMENEEMENEEIENEEIENEEIENEEIENEEVKYEEVTSKEIENEEIENEEIENEEIENEEIENEEIENEEIENEEIENEEIENEEMENEEMENEEMENEEIENEEIENEEMENEEMENEEMENEEIENEEIENEVEIEDEFEELEDKVETKEYEDEGEIEIESNDNYENNEGNEDKYSTSEKDILEKEISMDSISLSDTESDEIHQEDENIEDIHESFINNNENKNENKKIFNNEENNNEIVEISNGNENENEDEDEDKNKKDKSSENLNILEDHEEEYDPTIINEETSTYENTNEENYFGMELNNVIPPKEHLNIRDDINEFYNTSKKKRNKENYNENHELNDEDNDNQTNIELNYENEIFFNSEFELERYHGNNNEIHDDDNEIIDHENEINKACRNENTRINDNISEPENIDDDLNQPHIELEQCHNEHQQSDDQQIENNQIGDIENHNTNEEEQYIEENKNNDVEIQHFNDYEQLIEENQNDEMDNQQTDEDKQYIEENHHNNVEIQQSNEIEPLIEKNQNEEIEEKHIEIEHNESLEGQTQIEEQLVKKYYIKSLGDHQYNDQVIESNQINSFEKQQMQEVEENKDNLYDRKYKMYEETVNEIVNDGQDQSNEEIQNEIIDLHFNNNIGDTNPYENIGDNAIQNMHEEHFYEDDNNDFENSLNENDIDNTENKNEEESIDSIQPVEDNYNNYNVNNDNEDIYSSFENKDLTTKEMLISIDQDNKREISFNYNNSKNNENNKLDDILVEEEHQTLVDNIVNDIEEEDNYDSLEVDTYINEQDNIEDVNVEEINIEVYDEDYIQSSIEEDHMNEVNEIIIEDTNEYEIKDDLMREKTKNYYYNDMEENQDIDVMMNDSKDEELNDQIMYIDTLNFNQEIHHGYYNESIFNETF